MSVLRGTCTICGWEGEFLQQQLQREGTLCGNCSASSRHRAVVHLLGLALGRGGTPVYAWPADRSLAILESSARGSYPMMLADKYDYYRTEYDPERIARGDRPREYADFQKLHYADGTFDAVIASDVFEHVRDDAAGYREIHRVLKPGGSFVLTVPYDHARAETVRRVDTGGPEDVLLMEPEYHGGGGHTLTYRNYGRDLANLLAGAGFAVAHIALDIPGQGITPQSAFLCRKGRFVDVADRRTGRQAASPLGPLAPFRLFLLLKYNLAGFLHYLKEARRG